MSAAPLRIAIADDERDMREFLQEALLRLGHEVVAVAETGRQLAEQCRAAAPDLVISDIKMPDGDGLEAAAAVNRVRPTPFLLVSAYDDAGLVARAAAEPVMGYLVKPVKEVDLKSSVPVAVARFQQMQGMAREAAELRQALEDRKLIERAKGAVMRRVGIDEEEAFRRMKKVASVHNWKVRDLAARIIAAEDVFHQLDKM
jgi:response regulator NasT